MNESALTKDDVRALQERMNRFVHLYLRGLGPVHVDGVLGEASRGRIRTIKYYLGYLKPINGVVNIEFRQRLWHPKNVKYSTLTRIHRGMARRTIQRKKAKDNDKPRAGVGKFDGIACANAAIPILEWCRNNGWHGGLVSGYRTPAYSESLCYRMCGRPRCPGRCAGKSTNHAFALIDRFAVDVSDYVKFREVVAKCPLHPRIWNNLPNDRVHFSPSGN